ncbi:MAG: hypothetical protein ACP5QT_05085 [Brevinematia bacterium]
MVTESVPVTKWRSVTCHKCKGSGKTIYKQNLITEWKVYNTFDTFPELRNFKHPENATEETLLKIKTHFSDSLQINEKNVSVDKRLMITDDSMNEIKKILSKKINEIRSSSLLSYNTHLYKCEYIIQVSRMIMLKFKNFGGGKAYFLGSKPELYLTRKPISLEVIFSLSIIPLFYIKSIWFLYYNLLYFLSL